MKNKFQSLAGIAIIGILAYAVIVILKKLWGLFIVLNPTIAAGIITAASTMIVATITISVGRLLEKKKDIEAHYRSTKTEIYDEFLKKFFEYFYDNDKFTPDEMAIFLREWQRKMIIWGGQDVLAHYIKWMTKLKQGHPDAQTMFMTEELFRLIRKDLGNKSSKLPKGFVAYIMLKNPELFLAMASKNPNISLTELSIIEKSLQEEETA